MLIETARVVAVEQGWLRVETVRRSVCAQCSAARGCGHSLLHRLGEGRRSCWQLSSAGFSETTFKVNDEVAIGIPESLLLRGSFLVYMLPLAAMLALALLASALFGDVAAVLGAALGLWLGMNGVRRHARRHRGDPALQPTLLGHAGAQPLVMPA